MSSETANSVGQITTASKVKLVVSGSELEKIHSLPVDEYFDLLEEATPEQLQLIIHSFEKVSRTKSGASLLQKIIAVPQGRRSLFSILMWWESRRPVYNIIVGLAGLPSILLLSLFGMGHAAVVAAFVYAICANICYCLGAPAEVVARACYKQNAETYAPVLFTLGTIFSVVLTVLLELLVFAALVFGAVSGRF